MSVTIKVPQTKAHMAKVRRLAGKFTPAEAREIRALADAARAAEKAHMASPEYIAWCEENRKQPAQVGAGLETRPRKRKVLTRAAKVKAG